MKLFGAKLLFVAALVAALARTGAAQAPHATTSPIDPELPIYTQTSQVKGKVSLAGSYTMAQLASIWADTFKKANPEVEFELVAQGTAAALPALINGQAEFALLSRPINEEEVKAFQAKFGYLPTVVVPALEQIAIYVNKDNPIKSITLPQLDAAFSKTMKRGNPKPVTTWGDLGVAGPLASQPLLLEGRRDATGLQVFFQLAILGGGEFKDNMVENISNIDVTKSIAANPNAIGFGGAAFLTPDVKAVPIQIQEGAPAIGILDPNYPLVRPLQIVINHQPNKTMEPAQLEFYKFIFSQRGQQDVIIGGLVPITSRPAQIALEAIGVHTLN